MKSNLENYHAFHLAGVVPVSGAKTDFEFEWSDCLIPITANYTAIERSVIECAYAGCENIWIVADDDISPLIKHRLGDFVVDPYSIKEGHFRKYPAENWKTIPVYYIPINPKDRGKIDCYAWSILYGALTAYNICKKFSRWAIPDRYYVSFPFSIYPPQLAEEHRKDISSKRPFYFSSSGKTIKDGSPLGFTFNGEDFKRFRRVVRSGTGMYTSENLLDGKYPQEKLSPDKRYSARLFTLDKVFESVTIDIAKVVELPWYFEINNWDNYRSFLASQESAEIKRPSKNILKSRELKRIGEKE